ncbi:MAG TPA: hypothetical protein VFJ86_14725 [Usitatibacter sp.]|nr:hypothetical protein [Usitatibacter sp.]
MFGAIFNGAIASRVAEAPAALHGKLPNGVDGVIGFLQKSHGQTAAETYLRHAISAATRDIFLGMAVIALAILGILAMVPRKFPTAE